MYLERAGDLTLLLTEKDQAEGTVHCFSLTEGALFVEAEPQTDISRRITAFQYELVPSQRPGAHMYPYLHSGLGKKSLLTLHRKSAFWLPCRVEETESYWLVQREGVFILALINNLGDLWHQLILCWFCLVIFRVNSSAEFCFPLAFEIFTSQFHRGSLHRMYF